MQIKHIIKPSFKLSIASLLVITLISCTQAGSNGTNSSTTKQLTNSKSSGLLKNNLYVARLGSGYDSVSGSVTSGQSCLKNAVDKNIQISNPEAGLNFVEQQSLSTLAHTLGVNVGGTYGAGKFSVSLASNFATSSQNNAYTTNIIYLYTYGADATFINGSLDQGLSSLTDTAKALAQSDPAGFRTMCGDEFIEAMKAGAVLAVRLQFSFNSHQDQEKLAASLNGNFGLASITTDVQQMAASNNVHVNFSLSALQLGGQPEKLNEIFGEPETGGNYPFINCGSISGTNTASCMNMINSIIKYGNSMETQLQKSDHTIDQDRLYYSNPTITKYQGIESATGPSSEVLEAMANLSAEYDKAFKDYTFVTHYQNALSDKLDTPTLENLKDAEKRLGLQLNNIYRDPSYRVIDCYKGYVSDQCLTIKGNVDHALQQDNVKLSDTERKLVDYLESNSYKVKLYNYYGSVLGEDIESNYALSNDACILAPTSSSTWGEFAINCNGQWLTSPNTLTMRISGFDNGLIISGLSYISVSPNLVGNSQLITYPDISITSSAEDPNNYRANGVNVTGGKSFIQPNAKLNIQRASENQA